MNRHITAAVTFASMLALAVGCTTTTSQESSSTNPDSTSMSDQPPNVVAGIPIPAGRVDDAVGKLDGLVADLMKSSGIPGMAVAVVHGGKTVYAKGFGVREEGRTDAVDADTVFQLASVSKSLGATVVAHQVGAGTIAWDIPVVSKLPWFALSDPYVTQHVTVGDLYSHRSGLGLHAGDKLEDLGYDGREVLERLRFEPLDPFRVTYHYTNFGMTAAAEAVAQSAGIDWAALSEQTLYQPLGMTSTSSRFADFEARPNHAVGHMLVDGKYVAKAVRDPDPQSPAGGASSSVNDMSRWLTMILGNGTYEGKEIAPAEALLPAVTPQVIANQAPSPDSRAGYYGFGFNVSQTPAGRTTFSHSGAFASGAATNFVVIPSADVAIVALTNAAPIGIPETLTAEFSDLVQFGEVRQDWKSLYNKGFEALDDPEGSLAGRTAPADAAPPQPLSTYVGSYASQYWGPATISESNGGLVLTLGPKAQTFPLSHWDGDTFTFELNNENAPPGTISTATFAGNALTLEYYDDNGLGRFTR